MRVKRVFIGEFVTDQAADGDWAMTFHTLVQTLDSPPSVVRFSGITK